MCAVVAVNEALGKPISVLRWSVVRLVFPTVTSQGIRVGLFHNWQVGDGRERAVLLYVLENATQGDPQSVADAIDEYALEQAVLINIGDEKGQLLDDIVERERPKLYLELGAYIGYSAVRTGALLQRHGGRLVSVEFNQQNAFIAQTIVNYAGLGDTVTVVHGYLGDGGATVKRLEKQYGFGKGALDFALLDHAKEAYLPDLKTILSKGWLRAGSVVCADNMRVPGVPDYAEYMRRGEGKRLFRTVEHEAHLEYSILIKDMLMESVVL